MTDPFVCLPVRESTKKKLSEIKKVFLKEHPEFVKVNITYDFLVDKLMEYYLDG